MKHIDITSKDGRFIKISDDKEFTEIGIYCENADQANELVVKLIPVLLKGE